MEYDLFTNAYQGFTNELNSVVVSYASGETRLVVR